ncbi:unnamed protein product [Didymodactylos carnosus]|uniref:Uncharacterized protein n=1 Tax=Didymodactylos carnosus TaxID=1234261 RepID=A0A813UTF7_9BILA|nr:unnamed protein product [Didymodactylos carnosus]CAF1240906.1 unnamed protein product [Didymodactylos carnosus]CAF3621778.1 unnamed protein product [Didymodactylos carnosus]CAF4048382.1 unnamed protein product [Didymodactylos carnosus]
MFYFEGRTHRDAIVCLILIIIIWGILSLSIERPIQLLSSTKHSSSRDFFFSSLCGRLIRQDKTVLSVEIDRLDSELRRKQQLTYNDTYIAYDCSTKTIFPKYKITEEEKQYPIAFTILMYDNLFQFEQLLKTIYRPHNFYCIHIDLKTSHIIYKNVKIFTKCLKNVYLSPVRYNVTWGRYSVLEAEQECQQYLLKFPQWNYYLNLAGSDFPLKTNLELVQILKLLNNQNDVTSMPYGQLKQNQKKNNRQLQKIPPFRMIIYKGEFHVTLSRKFVEFVHSSSMVREYYLWLNNTYVPDEHFYSTINRLKQAPGHYTYDWDIEQYISRYKIWGDRPNKELCQGKYVRGICVFNWKDLWHVSTGPQLFVNKFSSDYDPIGLYCLEKYLQARIDDQTSITEEYYYKSLNTVKYSKHQS